jgi:hypothetical protein
MPINSIARIENRILIFFHLLCGRVSIIVFSIQARVVPLTNDTENAGIASLFRVLHFCWGGLPQKACIGKVAHAAKKLQLRRLCTSVKQKNPRRRGILFLVSLSFAAECQIFAFRALSARI